MMNVRAFNKPIFLITVASGNIDRSRASLLLKDHRVIGLDRRENFGGQFPVFAANLSSPASIELALHKARDTHGARPASVMQLVAYFDFTNEENPLYDSINVESTRSLLRCLQSFDVEQFIYASTMLVQAPCRPGERIDKTQPIAPSWAHPKSIARAEEVLRRAEGKIPYVNLRLAGVYDTTSKAIYGNWDRCTK